jgi:hypothetical protein
MKRKIGKNGKYFWKGEKKEFHWICFMFLISGQKRKDKIKIMGKKGKKSGKKNVQKWILKGEHKGELFINTSGFGI